MSGVTPLLDFFKRGEVESGVRLLAAEGGLAPRALEQIALLVLLTEDPEPHIRAAANETIGRIPVEAMSTFLARSDVSVQLRDFFAQRGVLPGAAPAAGDSDEDPPLIDRDPGGPGQAEAEDDGGEGPRDKAEEEPAGRTIYQRVAGMGFSERLRAAMKGSREERALLIRDANKLIAASVLSSPKLTDIEVEGFARMPNVSEDVLRTIGSNRAWMKRYPTMLALAKNPKTPIAVSLNLLQRINDRDLVMLSLNRNVPDQLRVAARRKVNTANIGRQ